MDSTMLLTCREVHVSSAMLLTYDYSYSFTVLQRMKNYLTYRVASSLTLALFFVVSASAFNPQAYLGCVPTNDTLPTDVAGEVCQLDRMSGASIVVDMHGVAIPNFFLLNILQVSQSNEQ